MSDAIERFGFDEVTHFKKNDIYEEHIARYEFAIQFVRSKRVLDIACGTGYGAAILAKLGAREVVGGDISVKVIQKARDKYKDNNLFFSQVDAEELPFDDERFEVIVSFETIEHLENQRKYLNEIGRVLRLNGKFIISSPDKKMTKYLGINNPFHINEIDRNELIKLVTESGFKVAGEYVQVEVPRMKLREKFLQKIYICLRKFKLVEIIKKILMVKNKKREFIKEKKDFMVSKREAGKRYLYNILVCEKV